MGHAQAKAGIRPADGHFNSLLRLRQWLEGGGPAAPAAVPALAPAAAAEPPVAQGEAYLATLRFPSAAALGGNAGDPVLDAAAWGRVGRGEGGLGLGLVSQGWRSLRAAFLLGMRGVSRHAHVISCGLVYWIGVV